MKFSVLGAFGPHCIEQDDGDQLYKVILGEVSAGRSVELDFSGVELFASPFFNHAIGRLFNQFSEDEIKKMVSFENITDVGERIVNRVIKNSVAYHSSTKRQDAINDIINKRLDEEG